MRKTIISVLMATFLCSAVMLFCQTKDLFYGGNIFVEENASQKLKDMAQELGFWLAKGTGKNFNITKQIPENGIFLLD
ncbi:MAG: hypothetical protein ACP5QD_01215, partial [Candidatus Ratteibacteria bacterium]